MFIKNKDNTISISMRTPRMTLETSLLPTSQYSTRAILLCQLPLSSLITEFQDLNSHVVSLIKFFYSRSWDISVDRGIPTHPSRHFFDLLASCYIHTGGLLLRTVSYQLHLNNNNSTPSVVVHTLHLQNIFIEKLMNEHGNTLWESQETAEEGSVENLIHLSTLISYQ